MGKNKGEKKDEAKKEQKPTEEKPKESASKPEEKKPVDQKPPADKKLEKPDAKPADKKAEKEKAATKKDDKSVVKTDAAKQAPKPASSSDRTLLIVLVVHTVLFAVFIGGMLTMQGDDVFSQWMAVARGYAADIGRQFNSQTTEMQIGVGSVAAVWFLASNAYILNKVL